MKTKTGTVYVTSEDTVAEVTTSATLYPRVIEWQDLLAAVEVEPEDSWSWDDLVCDVEISEFRPPWGAPESAREYWRRQDTVRGHHEIHKLALTLEAEKDARSYYNKLRARGASRQVARECVAADRAAALRHARRLLAGDAGVYWFHVEFYDASAGLGMVMLDDTIPGGDPYADDIRAELAGEVARELEGRGFIVTGRPEVATPPRRFYGTYPHADCFIASQLPRAIETDKRRAARGGR